MKSASDKRSYFAAYPLKALNLPEEEFQAEVKLWENSNSVTMKDLRVFPMVNPYREKDFKAETGNSNE